MRQSAGPPDCHIDELSVSVDLSELFADAGTTYAERASLSCDGRRQV